jgi:hypothetical protein
MWAIAIEDWAVRARVGHLGGGDYRQVNPMDED